MAISDSVLSSVPSENMVLSPTSSVTDCDTATDSSGSMVAEKVAEKGTGHKHISQGVTDFKN